MAMQKVYQRINWQNYPSEETALSASNLNKTDYAINAIDNRVISLDTEKLNVQDANTLVKNVALDNETGVLTVTYKNGTTSTFQTVLNQVAINFTYNTETQQIDITESDGTVKHIDLTSFITQYEFNDSTTIHAEVGADGKITHSVIGHSIGEEHLRTDYLADIQVAEANAEQAESNAEAHQFQSEAWAVGQKDGADVPDTDATYHNNSKYYSEISAGLKTQMETIKSDAQSLLDQATARLTGLQFIINFADGCLYYDDSVGINLQIDPTTGNLMWEVIT